jgi:hypothetical protein
MPVVDTLLPMVLAAMSWAISGVVTVSVMKSKMQDFERRLGNMETEHKTLVKDFTQYQIETLKHLVQREKTRRESEE